MFDTLRQTEWQDLRVCIAIVLAPKNVFLGVGKVEIWNPQRRGLLVADDERQLLVFPAPTRRCARVHQTPVYVREWVRVWMRSQRGGRAAHAARVVGLRTSLARS